MCINLLIKVTNNSCRTPYPTHLLVTLSLKGVQPFWYGSVQLHRLDFLNRNGSITTKSLKCCGAQLQKRRLQYPPLKQISILIN